MTDSHSHIIRGTGRHFLCCPCECSPQGNIMFYGCHPWHWQTFKSEEDLRNRMEENPSWGIGEIGLDRLKEREIPQGMRDVFQTHLKVAAQYERPVVLHGAKCWGEVVKACMSYNKKIPAFLFHGFSRSGGLIPDIVKLNGFVSVGPAILNDHAVNYRTLVRSLPKEIILIESDATAENVSEVPALESIAAKICEIRQISIDEFSTTIEDNANRFVAALQNKIISTTANKE